MKVVWSLVIGAIAAVLWAQQEGKEQLLYREPPVTMQMLTLPLPKDSVEVLLLVRFNLRVLGARQERKPGQGVVPVSFVWEFRDSNRFIVKSTILTDTLVIGSERISGGRVLRIYKMQLPKQRYIVAVRFRDRHYATVFADTIQHRQLAHLEIFSPVAYRWKGRQRLPIVLHRVVPYGPETGGLLFPALLHSNAGVPVLQWRLEWIAADESAAIWQWVPIQRLEGNATWRPGKVVLLQDGEQLQVDLAKVQGAVLRDQPPEQRYPGWIEVPLGPDVLFPGTYRLQLFIADTAATKSVSYQFQVRWFYQPFSLQRLKIAQRMLRLLLDEAQQEWLISGTTAQQVEKFHHFWRYVDPTPETAYNEALVSFYKRVDYAAFNLGDVERSFRRLDDRQKVYVYYGPPVKKSRILEPDGEVREIWDYRKYLHRIFVFERMGREYRLVEIRKEE